MTTLLFLLFSHCIHMFVRKRRISQLRATMHLSHLHQMLTKSKLTHPFFFRIIAMNNTIVFFSSYDLYPQARDEWMYTKSKMKNQITSFSMSLDQRDDMTRYSSETYEKQKKKSLSVVILKNRWLEACFLTIIKLSEPMSSNWLAFSLVMTRLNCLHCENK